MPNSKRILVVEDEALIALDIENILVEAGHEVSAAASCREAETFLTGARFDLAIVDFHLRDGDATRLALQLKQHAIPFVLCSGLGGLKELGDTLTPAQVISKPYSVDDLLRSVDAVSDVLRNRVQAFAQGSSGAATKS